MSESSDKKVQYLALEVLLLAYAGLMWRLGEGLILGDLVIVLSVSVASCIICIHETVVR